MRERPNLVSRGSTGVRADVRHQQDRRHFADYDPDYLVRKSDVIADIESVRTAIDRFLGRRPTSAETSPSTC